MGALQVARDAVGRWLEAAGLIVSAAAPMLLIGVAKLLGVDLLGDTASGREETKEVQRTRAGESE